MEKTQSVPFSSIEHFEPGRLRVPFEMKISRIAEVSSVKSETSSLTISFLLNSLFSCSETGQANQHNFQEEEAELQIYRLLTPTYLKGEGIRVVPSLLQQRVVHAAQGRLVALRVDLDLLDPDVLPEAEAHHVQVVAAVAEGARQLHKHCAGDTIRYFTQTQQHFRSYSRHSNLSCLESLLCPA